MRILADENFPRLAVDALREQGHDVLWIHSDFPGWNDTRILRHAQQERRLIVTLDKDFGELAFRFGLPASCGVIFFRLRGFLSGTHYSTAAENPAKSIRLVRRFCGRRRGPNSNQAFAEPVGKEVAWEGKTTFLDQDRSLPHSPALWAS